MTIWLFGLLRYTVTPNVYVPHLTPMANVRVLLCVCMCVWAWVHLCACV